MKTDTYERVRQSGGVGRDGKKEKDWRRGKEARRGEAGEECKENSDHAEKRKESVCMKYAKAARLL